MGHSASPAMHNAAFRYVGMNAQYIPFEVPPGEIIEAVEGFRALNFLGFNVTVPYKEAVLEHLDDVTKLAKVIGAVNTVVNRDGKLTGYNTDGPGFIESLKEDAGFDPKGKSAVVIGAGGAGRAISIMLAECAATSVVIADIDLEKGEELAEYIRNDFNCKCEALLPADMAKAVEKGHLLVNASPVGMHPKDNECPLPGKVKIPPKTLVYDLVYNPQETLLLRLAKESKARGVSGLGMLVRQGALAFSIFTDEEAPIEVMWNAAREIVTKK